MRTGSALRDRARRPLAGAALAVIGVLAFVFAPDGRNASAARPCVPTRADSEGPYYKPGAPLTTSTGAGLMVRGRLLGTPDCGPLDGGRIEWWQTNPKGRYDDAHRGSQGVDSDGNYRFDTDFPGIYPGRPPHIHLKASAPGYRTLTTQLYLRGGETEAVFDIVLVPDR